ncbi:MAG: S8 family serine peptidase, partial [Phycisphaerae bacterium]|nr:S8 family serine peptidase [Phycisphaerae bacterium]
QHPDLSANLWINPGESGNGRETNGVDDDGNGYIDDVHGINALVPLGQRGNGDPSETEGEGHGTAVAGIIGAVGNNGLGVAGVSWKASLMPLKFRSSADTGTVADAIECMNYALAKGAKVVNASYGFSEFSQAEFEVIQRLRDAGVIVVASAGNSNLDTALFPVYPACHLIENV